MTDGARLSGKTDRNADTLAVQVVLILDTEEIYPVARFPGEILVDDVGTLVHAYLDALAEVREYPVDLVVDHG